MHLSNFRLLLAMVSAIVLFLYGLKAFSQEIQRTGGETLKKLLARITESYWRGLVLGAVATAIVQSSSVVTSLTVALVDAGTIAFRSSLAKAAFYFGFIFFSLDVVSSILKPLAQNPVFTGVLSRSSTPLMRVFAGALIMAVAWGQLIFAVVTRMIMLLLLYLFQRRLARLEPAAESAT